MSSKTTPLSGPNPHGVVQSAGPAEPPGNAGKTQTSRQESEPVRLSSSKSDTLVNGPSELGGGPHRLSAKQTGPEPGSPKASRSDKGTGKRGPFVSGLPTLPDDVLAATVARDSASGPGHPKGDALGAQSLAIIHGREGRVEADTGPGSCKARFLRGSGGATVAVAKPDLSFPMREQMTPGFESWREASAYSVAAAAGIDTLIPTTKHLGVVKLDDQYTGNVSVQQYIPHALSLQQAYVGNDGDAGAAIEKCLQLADYQRAIVLLMLIGHLDGHPENVLITAKDADGRNIDGHDWAKRMNEPGVTVQLHLIDNGLSFPEGPADELKSSLGHLPSFGNVPFTQETIAIVRSWDPRAIVGAMPRELGPIARSFLEQRIAIIQAVAQFDRPVSPLELMGRIAYARDMSKTPAMDPTSPDNGDFFAKMGLGKSGMYPGLGEWSF